MTARLFKPAISFVTVGAVVIAALAVYLSLSTGTSHADSVYTPVYESKYCNAMDPAFPNATIAATANPLCADNLQTGASPATTTFLTMDAADLNFSNVTTFAPAAGTITDGNTIPSGTLIGGLRSLTNLGLLNGLCNTALVVDFVLYNVAKPNNAGNPRASTNIIYPMPDGSPNRFSHWQVGSEPASGSPINVNDADSDLRADSNEEAINNYPKYLLDVFDPDFLPPPGVDGPANPIVPKAVYGGLTNVANTWVPLFFAQFDPGQLTAMPGAPSQFVAAMGAPNVSVLNDPSAVAVSPSSITDFCTPLDVTTVLLGTSGAHTRATSPTCVSPATQCTQYGVQYNASLRDLDQDGFENAIDTCPFNASSNPRAAGGDADSDGIGDACDTNLPNASGTDVDGDGFQNRQDNCPQVANAGAAQADSEVSVSTSNTADKGPKTDTIGDACDSEAGVVSATVNGRPVNFTMSDTVSNGRYHAVTSHQANCFGPTAAGGTDADGDGYCSTQDNAESNAVRHTGWTNANAAAVAGIGTLDTDGDAFTDAQETYLGTEQTKACPFDTTTNNEAPLDNWPFDFNDQGTANSIDVGTYVPRLNKDVATSPATPRWDLTFDGIVNSIDVGRFVAVLNKTCTGTMGFASYASQSQ